VGILDESTGADPRQENGTASADDSLVAIKEVVVTCLQGLDDESKQNIVVPADILERLAYLRDKSVSELSMNEVINFVTRCMQYMGEDTVDIHSIEKVMEEVMNKLELRKADKMARAIEEAAKAKAEAARV